MNLEIANRLVELRKSHGLSQETLAEQLGVSRQSVSKWERGEASPDLVNLMALAEIYQVSLDDIIYGVHTETTEKKKERVHIGFDGLHVDTDREKVHISRKGIHIEDQNNNIHIQPGHIFNAKTDPSDVEISIPFHHRDSHHRRHILHPIYVFLVIFGFFLWGFWGDGWYISWTLFLTIPIVTSLIEAIARRNASIFAYPVLVIFAYLFGGLLIGWWGTAWILFFTIPLYYLLVNLLKKSKS